MKKSQQFSDATDGVSLSFDNKKIMVDYYIGKKRKQKTFARNPGESAPAARKRGVALIAQMQDRAETKRLTGEGLLPRRIEDIIASYYADVSFMDLAKGTRIRNARHLRAFQVWCHKEGISNAGAIDVRKAKEYQAWYRREHRQLTPGLSGTTEDDYEYFPRGTNNNISAVRCCFALEMENTNRLVTDNPFFHVKNLRVKKSRVRFLTKEESGLIFFYADQWEYHIFSILYYSAMRTIELRHLEQSWIARDLSSIAIPESSDYTDFTTKNHLARTVECDEGIRPHLEYFLNLNKGERFLVCGNRVTPPNLILSHYRGICKKIKKDFPHIDLSDTNVHSLRKTGGSYMHQAGVPIQFTSLHLGHSSIKVTQDMYVAPSDENVREAIKSLPRVETLMETIQSKKPVTHSKSYN